MKQSVRLGVLSGLSVLLAACGSSNSSSSGPALPSGVEVLQGAYHLSIFAQATGVLSTLRPDDLLQVGSTVYVNYQDHNNLPDGSSAPGTTPQSMLAAYNLQGQLLATYKVPGHPDGLVTPDGSKVWVSSNEDGNPLLTILDPQQNTLTTLSSDTLPLPHGGGLDDMKVIGGQVYVSASAPSTTMSPTPNLAPYSTDASGATAQFGVNTGPVVYQISLNSDGKTYHLTSVLSSSTPATLLPGKTAVTLNMTDADSSAIDPAGDLVIDSQQDSELVFIKNPGQSGMAASVLPITLYGNPWPIDDTRWAPAASGTGVVPYMLFSDNKAQIIYRVDENGGFTAGTAYSSAQGMITQTDTGSGMLTPIIMGLNAPHGLIFVQP